MRIHFDEIPVEGLRAEINDVVWFPDQEVRRRGPVRAAVFLERKGDRVLLAGEIQGVLILECDRCLARFDSPLEADFSLDLELFVGGKGPVAAEHACPPGEMDVLFLEEPAIDLFQVLRQQLFLTLPAKRLCRENCQGLCPRCGADLNTERCGCARTSSSSPFAVLKNLKKE